MSSLILIRMMVTTIAEAARTPTTDDTTGAMGRCEGLKVAILSPLSTVIPFAADFLKELLAEAGKHGLTLFNAWLVSKPLQARQAP